MEKELIKIAARKQYNTTNLEIASSLAGAFHSFEFNGQCARISLPKRPKQQNWKKSHTPINCWGYSQKGNRKNPLSYAINQITLTIDIEKTYNCKFN